MDKVDISVHLKEGMFNYRVGAVILDEDKVLLAKNNGSEHYYTVGGRVRFGESAQEAVLREVYEELSVKLEIEKMIYIHENFFTWESNARPCHEIALFFLMKPNPQLRALKLDPVSEEYGDVSFHWLSVDELEKLTVYPDFLKFELRKRKKKVRHLITKSGKTVSASKHICI